MMRHGCKASGLFLAVLALVAQLAMAAMMPAVAGLAGAGLAGAGPAGADPGASLADVAVLCHHDDGPDTPAAPVHPSPACLLCFFCHAAAGPMGLAGAPPVLPRPGAGQVVRSAMPPPATAPPLRMAQAARPRGPPVPV
jgi:hypothetical protein